MASCRQFRGSQAKAAASRQDAHRFDNFFVELLFGAFLLTNILSKHPAVNIHELASQTGVAERQIRYLISEGFMPAPRGGRSNADYGDEHVAAVRRYARLRELGFPPAAIRLLLESKQGAPFAVAPGITLVVDPKLIGSGAEIVPLAERITSLLTDLLKDPSHDD
jgi:MerR family copper efflux transcriptional regulator